MKRKRHTSREEQPNKKHIQDEEVGPAVVPKGSTDLSQEERLSKEAKLFKICGMNSLNRYLDMLDQYCLMNLVEYLAVNDYTLFERIDQFRERGLEKTQNLLLSLDQIEEQFQNALNSIGITITDSDPEHLQTFKENKDSLPVINLVNLWRERTQMLLNDDKDLTNYVRIIHRLTMLCAKAMKPLNEQATKNGNITEDAINKLIEDWRDLIQVNESIADDEAHQARKKAITHVFGSLESLKADLKQCHDIFSSDAKFPTSSLDQVLELL